MLMYGKYGFGINDYIQLVKDAAAKVNLGANPLVITQAEIDEVVGRELWEMRPWSLTLWKRI